MYEGVFLTGIQDSLHRLIYKPYLCNPQAQRNSRWRYMLLFMQHTVFVTSRCIN